MHECEFVSIGGNRKTQSIALFKRHLGKHHAQLYKDLYKEPDVAEEKSDGTPKKRKAEEEAEDPNTPCTDKARSKKARQTLFQKTIPQVVQEKEPLPFHSTRAQEIHKAIAEYLNVDMVPFDAVNSAGFLRLMKIMEPRFEVASHTYYSNQVEVIMKD